MGFDRFWAKMNWNEMNSVNKKWMNERKFWKIFTSKRISWIFLWERNKAIQKVMNMIEKSGKSIYALNRRYKLSNFQEFFKICIKNLENRFQIKVILVSLEILVSRPNLAWPDLDKFPYQHWNKVLQYVNFQPTTTKLLPNCPLFHSIPNSSKTFNYESFTLAF